MTSRNAHRLLSATWLRPAAVLSLTAATLALGLGGCRIGDEPGAHVAGWTLVDARQRHPILVSEQPANLTLRIARGAHGLNPQQRASAIDFMARYRGRDTGNAHIAVGVPSGSANEIASMHAVAELRQIMHEFAIGDANIAIRPYASAGEREPPIRIAYTRFVAEAPECGDWSTNLAEDPRNVYYPNFGCAQQRNLAAQIANPADLLGPRTMTPAGSERRDVIWDKFNKGDSTITKKDNDERTQTKNVQ